MGPTPSAGIRVWNLDGITSELPFFPNDPGPVASLSLVTVTGKTFPDQTHSGAADNNNNNKLQQHRAASSRRRATNKVSRAAEVDLVAPRSHANHIPKPSRTTHFSGYGQSPRSIRRIASFLYVFPPNTITGTISDPHIYPLGLVETVAAVASEL